ncbi:restriction endonuclease [Halorubrum sp. Atlit-8R]|uniref:restriction endonuclease n=1 Tax=unclassified Halorubrum TaxID=2642239 RepID=UPI000EF202DE|nr:MULTISPECIES: restriction endonuclease [unclassified Halorubrum]RLM63791.1 restriction endonuclease [Halorubrum sp. Atlit-9R]RLM77169.1 restriction endonuclease [Halorubrum sp. Atlit-8R]
MKRSRAKDELLDHALSIEPEEFEQLSKILVEQTEQTNDAELTPFHGDGGIDIRGSIGREFYRAQFGVQVKQYTQRVGSPAMRNFVGALSSHDYQFGSFITSSEFNSGAIDVAEGEVAQPITLIDRDRLTDIMLEEELGVVQAGGEFEIDHEFWDLFGTSTGEDLVKSDAVPQADSFDVINTVIEGIDEGHRYKHQILEYMKRMTGEDWTPRQADYYPQAAWALGYVHKDPQGEYDGRQMRQWGLTRDGEEYLTFIREEDDESAQDSLLKHIQEADIIQSVLQYLREHTPISHDDLAQVIERESELNETTAKRRRGTVGKWLNMLPEVRQSRDGQTYKYEYLEKNLGDY